MAESSRLNRVCSVLFVDLVGYSRLTVAEQMERRRVCTELVGEALGPLSASDRIIADTGDGAAVTFLGAPENALFVALRARDAAGDLALRMGVNLGPVRVTQDLNGQQNVVGDGINVAQRVMSFSNPGELLVSRSFYEVACRLATDYVNLFVPRGAHDDKHGRTHEVYALVPDARARLKAAEMEWLQRTSPPRQVAASVLRRPAGTQTVRTAPPPPPPNEPAKVFDAGAHLIVSGYTRESVDKALRELGNVTLISVPAQMGEKWVATCEHPVIAECKVESIGYTRIITGPTREAVQIKVQEILNEGAVQIGNVEAVAGVWTAVCEIGVGKR
jgi:class 3 adenylate cyclase